VGLLSINPPDTAEDNPPDIVPVNAGDNPPDIVPEKCHCLFEIFFKDRTKFKIAE
jgi:hypothetical protein